MLNADLTPQWLEQSGRAHILNAFLDREVRVLTLPSGFGLYKLTSYPFTRKGDKGVTPWWCPLQPFEEEQNGIYKMSELAEANEVLLREYVRFACAVSVDWNTLDDLLTAELTGAVKCFWGKFAPQPVVTPGKEEKRTEYMTNNPSVYVPALKTGGQLEQFGGLDAWQFYIPNLTTDYVKATFRVSQAKVRMMVGRWRNSEGRTMSKL